MASNSCDLSFMELDEVHKNIVKHELIVEAVKNLVRKSVLAKNDEEHLVLALNLSEFNVKEVSILSHDHGNVALLMNWNIPSLKGFMLKELNEVFDLVHKLESTKSSVNRRENFVSKSTEIQSTVSSLSEVIHDLYGRLKLLLGLHTKKSSAPLKKSVESLALTIKESHRDLRYIEDAVLASVFHLASEEWLQQIEEDLEAEFQSVTEMLDRKEKTLEMYQSNREKLISVASQLRDINKEIEVNLAALKTLSFE